MRFKPHFMTLVGFVLAFSPMLASAQPRIDRICDLLLMNPATTSQIFKQHDAFIESKLDDADWVMEEALRTQLALGPGINNETSIAYFRAQLPTVIQSLLALLAHEDRPYWYTDTEDMRLANSVSTSKQALMNLIKEGLKRYLNDSANLQWFPAYMLEVTAIKKFILATKENCTYPDHSDDLKMNVSELNGWDMRRSIARAKLNLIDELSLGVLHWPTLAPLRIRHFRDWHLRIKPLGYTRNARAAYDGRSEETAYDYDLYIHDVIAHYLPQLKTPNYPFPAFKKIVDRSIELEANKDHQTLMRIYWFLSTHEYSDLFLFFRDIKAGYRAKQLDDKIFQLDINLSASRATERLHKRNDLRDEMPVSLLELSKSKRSAYDKELQAARDKFVNIVRRAFIEVMGPPST